MKIKGIIFDMDGTLVDSLMLWDYLWERFGALYCGGKAFRPDAETDRAIRTMTLKDGMELLHARCGLAESGAALLETANAVFMEFYTTVVQPKPGVREFLEDCRAKGVRMCVASATAPALLQAAVEHCGLGQYFEKIFSCSQVGKGKESPDIYRLALEYLGTPPEETWVFEDSYVALHTAVSMGLPTVGIYDQYSFDQDKLAAEATVYLAKGQTMAGLVAHSA